MKKQNSLSPARKCGGLRRLFSHSERTLGKGVAPIEPAGPGIGGLVAARDVGELGGPGRCAELEGDGGFGKGTVGNYLARARQAGLSWPLPAELDDDSLELSLFPSPTLALRLDRPVPDWAAMDVELHRPGVKRALLWEEYRA